MEGLSSVQIQLSSPLPPTGVSDINLQEYLQTSFCEILTDNNNNKKNHGKYYWRGFLTHPKSKKLEPPKVSIIRFTLGVKELGTLKLLIFEFTYRMKGVISLNDTQ